MNFDDIVKGIAEAIGSSIADKLGVAFNANTHRGMCAGSVQYQFVPSGEANECDVMGVVRAGYENLKLEIDLTSDEGCRTFFLVLLSACKELVKRGRRVNLADRLVYEAQAYSDGRDAWMKPIAVNREFNRLSTPVELDKALDTIRRSRQAAKRNPFDRAFEGEKAPQATYIVCEQCGHRNKIAET